MNRRPATDRSLRAVLPALALLTALSIFTQASSAQDDMRYRKVTIDQASCDVGVLYKVRPGGLDVVVSAIATGQGAEFRKWKVTDIRLRIGSAKIRPHAEGKFFVNKESFFRVPAAVVFAALGTQVTGQGNSLAQGITRAGATVGLGLLALTAKGDIAGERCVFKVEDPLATSINESIDAIEITVQNDDMHAKELIEVGLEKPEQAPALAPEYGKLTQDELRAAINAMAVQVGEFEKEKEGLRRGVDPRYDELQRKIDFLETRRGIAYKIWFERKQEGAIEGPATEAAE